MSASVSLKKSSNPFFTQARSPFTFQDINFVSKSFPYFSCLNCDILPTSASLVFDESRTADNPTLLTQDFSFLHFCNHKQNRSGCLQKIYPPSQVSCPVPPHAWKNPDLKIFAAPFPVLDLHTQKYNLIYFVSLIHN